MISSAEGLVESLISDRRWYDYGFCCNCRKLDGNGQHTCEPSSDRKQCIKWRKIKNFEKLARQLDDAMDKASTEYMHKN
ncbi:MAG: hypothetical protein IJQ29_05315 [Synergistaceae bacterium]|nr:hypothetical protein [Synergistaceae bacterium]